MNNIKIDFENNTIVVTRNFYERAMEFGSDEYTQLQNVKAQNPSMRISVRRIRQRTQPNSFKGLDYRYMRNFINIMDKENSTKFDEAMRYFEGLYKDGRSVYKAVRDWFLDNYPYHREMVVEAAPQVERVFEGGDDLRDLSNRVQLSPMRPQLAIQM